MPAQTLPGSLRKGLDVPTAVTSKWKSAYPVMDELLPPGRSGEWGIVHFEISEVDAIRHLAKTTLQGVAHRVVQPGRYMMLLQGETIVMSNTPAEQIDHYPPVEKAKGHVLINGLGIAMVLRAVLQKKEVKSVTVVELSEDVITLVAPLIDDPRVEIVHASAYDYKPPKGRRYGMVWHDIWNTITPDNLPEMNRLKRKYQRVADWQGCWAENECRWMKDEEKRLGIR